MAKATISTKGLDRYFEDVARAGANVEAAAARALQAGGEVGAQGMRRRVAKDEHYLERHIDVSPVENDGQYLSVRIGVLDEGPTDSKHSVADIQRYGQAQEFGTSSMAAHPYVRPTMAEDKGKIAKAMRDSLKAEGVVD